MTKVIVLIMILISCAEARFDIHDRERSEDKISSIHARYDVPVVNRDGSITILPNAYDVFYYKDLVMYRLFYMFDSTVDGDVLLREVRSQFLVFQRDSLFGYLFYPNLPHGMIKGRQPVDSLRKMIDWASPEQDSLLNRSPDSMYHDKEGNLLKVFNLKASKRYPEDFVFYLYYTDKLKNVTEKFSEAMDRFRGLKLFRIRILCKGAYYDEYKQYFPEREAILEMTETPVEDPDLVLSYFHDYAEIIGRH